MCQLHLINLLWSQRYPADRYRLVSIRRFKSCTEQLSPYSTDLCMGSAKYKHCTSCVNRLNHAICGVCTPQWHRKKPTVPIIFMHLHQKHAVRLDFPHFCERLLGHIAERARLSNFKEYGTLLLALRMDLRTQQQQFVSSVHPYMCLFLSYWNTQ